MLSSLMTAQVGFTSGWLTLFRREPIESEMPAAIRLLVFLFFNGHKRGWLFLFLALLFYENFFSGAICMPICSRRTKFSRSIC